MLFLSFLLLSVFPFVFPKNILLVNSYSGKNDDEILKLIISRYSGNLIIKNVGYDCQFYSFKYFLFLVRSRIWLTNVSMLYTSSWKSEECKYINIWHGIPIINIGNNATKINANYYQLGNVDLFPISSDYERILYSESLGVKNTAFFSSKNIRQSYYDEIGFNEEKSEKNILFYAPSWRDENTSDTLLSLTKLKEVSDDLNLNLVISLHHKVRNEINIPNNIRILDPNESREKIFKKTCVFISDYSSLIVDASRNKCKILLFISDFDKIVSKRGFYLKNLSNECYKDENLLLNDLKNGKFSKFSSSKLFKSYNKSNAINFITNILNE